MLNMPQEFHVLKCFACEIFQVHQTKKDKKWSCKVCGEKQTLKKAYFRGSARDCRSVVQKINLEEGEKKSRNDAHQSKEYEVLEDEPKDSFSFDSELEDPNVEDNPENSHCYRPLKKIRKNDYASSESIDKVVITSFIEMPCAEVLAPQDITKASDICFDLGFDENFPSPTLENEDLAIKTQHDPIRDSLFKKMSDEPQVPKNRGFQKILKAAQKLS